MGEKCHPCDGQFKWLSKGDSNREVVYFVLGELNDFYTEWTVFSYLDWSALCSQQLNLNFDYAVRSKTNAAEAYEQI